MSEMDIRPDDLDDIVETADSPEATEFDIETPEADAVEQHRSVRAGEERRERLPFDVDPADAAEQDRVVELDEDDYR
jgi:hypothetical protein